MLWDTKSTSTVTWNIIPKACGIVLRHTDRQIQFGIYDGEWGYDDYGYNAYGLGSLAFTNSLGLSTYWLPNLPTPRVNESKVASPSEMFAVGDASLVVLALLKME